VGYFVEKVGLRQFYLQVLIPSTVRYFPTIAIREWNYRRICFSRYRGLHCYDQKTCIWRTSYRL